jgi:hypoxanthine phosphoribosyltransferase
MYNTGIDSLCEQIINSGNRYDFIIGICRGGLIAATSLSYRLDIPLKIVTIQTYETRYTDVTISRSIIAGYNILLVDDIVDTGDTIKQLQDIWQIDKIDTACLVYNDAQNKVSADYRHIIIDKDKDPEWITFWWDKV